MKLILVLFVFGIAARQTWAVEAGPLLIVGGGNVPPEVNRKLVQLGGGREARVVVVPFASSLTNAGESAAEELRSLGARSVEVLSGTNRTAAYAALKRATAVWFTGGDQSSLMLRLNELGLVELIRERHGRGLVAGGTSAGAAVMSKVMIAGWKPGNVPLIGEGLGLWPEAIVDQHFVARGREPRLRLAVQTHPELLGVGIDEGTAVLARGSDFEVIGQSTVTVIEARGPPGQLEKTVVSAPQKFSLHDTKKPGNH
jgi:cyanophycinase